MNLKIMIFVFSSLFGTSYFQASDHGGKAVQDLGGVAQAQKREEVLKKLNLWFEEQENKKPGLREIGIRIIEPSRTAAEAARIAEQAKRVGQ
jgi:hypothetical protein